MGANETSVTRIEKKTASNCSCRVFNNLYPFFFGERCCINNRFLFHLYTFSLSLIKASLVSSR
jgi:hypothetical protein